MMGLSNEGMEGCTVIFYEAMLSDVSLDDLRPTDRVCRLLKMALEAERTYSEQMPRLARDAYIAHDGEPSKIKRAHAFSHMLDNMTQYILPGELLVGNRTERPGAQNSTPRDWWGDKDDPRTGNKNLEQYEASFLYPEFIATLSPEAKLAQDELLAGFPAGSAGSFGHIVAGYDMLLREGAEAIARRARASYEESADKDNRQANARLAFALSWEAFMRWAMRYRDLALSLSQVETGAERKAELLRIAETLEHVPAKPARTLREALQSFVLMHMALLIEQPGGGSISLSGLDRVLNPFLLADIETGRLNIDEAEELVDSMYVKLVENAIWPRDVVMFANLSIGGADETGDDATNDMSLIMLRSTARVRSSHPMLSVRWHRRIDQRFFLRVCELLRMGLGLPALFNDHEFVPVLLEWGATPEEAWRYGIVGCVEPAVMGVVHGQTMGGHINLLKCLELAMNDGRALMSGAQVGPRTGEFEDFQSFDHLMDAYKIQLEWAIKLNCEAVDAVGHSQQKLFGYPFMSATMQGAIAQGRDLVDGARINRATVCMVGMTNVVDALIAVEALVFEGGKIGKGELMEALRCDFSGFEALEALLLTGAPKFGNGEDGPVRLYNRLSKMQQRAFDRYTGPRGDRYNTGLWATTWHVTMGASTGASADGRRAGMPLVDGIGAVTGRATQGPTSVAVDVAKLEARQYWQGGYTFNMKFSKNLLEKEKGLLSFRDYLNTFFELGGMQMQINTISRELLLSAQREPEKHADLIVRVAGFSAYFIGLSRSVQDEIISRTEHAV